MFFDNENKENYNMNSEKFEPVKLQTQKRYQVLKNIVEKSSALRIKTQELRNLKVIEKNTLLLKSEKSGEFSKKPKCKLKQLEFVDECVNEYSFKRIS